MIRRSVGLPVLTGLLAVGLSAAYAQDESLPQPMPAEIQPLTPKSLLLDITRADSHLIAIGERGAIIASKDGRQWAQVEVPVRSTLTAVAFANDQVGWAVGHDAVILKTDDGGQHWALQHFDPPLEKPLLDLLVFDERHVLAVGAYGLMLETHDGGATWEERDVSAFNENEFHFNSIARLANGDLFIAGEMGMMLISGDDGANWKTQTSPYEGSYFGVLPRGARGALVFGLRGHAFVSDDARAGNWRAIKTGTVASMFGGAAMPDGGAVLVGLNGVTVEVAPDGSVKRARAPAGTALSAAIARNGGVIAVGESGVQPLSLAAGKP